MGKVEIKNLSKSFGNVKAIKNLSLSVEKGELITVVGPSGCGKTTLLRMIAGFIPPDNGSIKLNDVVFVDSSSNLPPVLPEKREIGMVFQSYAIWSHMNVFENIAYPLKIRKVDKGEIKERVEDMLRLIRLDGYEKRIPSELSGGQQQRVALARALIMKPKLLLLDEPLSNLDAALREGMRGELKSIQKKLNLTILNVTHDQLEALSMSDKVAILDFGQLIQFDTPQNIYKNPKNTFVAKFVASSNIIPATLQSADKKTGKMTVSVFGNYIVEIPYKTLNQTEGFIAIRTHQFLRCKEDEGIKVRIKNRLYLGNVIEYYAEVENGEIIRFTDDAMDYIQEDHINIKVNEGIWLSE